MADDRVEVEEGQEVVRRTIVGGRPRARPSIRMRVPIGLEKVLVRAAGDDAFREALLRDRLAAVEAMGWALEPSEATALASVPDAVLSSMIRHIDLKRHTQRRFGRSVATAAFASAALTASVEGGCAQSAGIDPYTDVNLYQDSAGIDPGRLDIPEYYPDAGILPDEGDLDVPMVSDPGGILPDPDPWDPDVPDVLPDDGQEIEVEEPWPDLGITDEGAPPGDEGLLDVDSGPQVGGITPDVPPSDDTVPQDDLPPQD